jgi:hypothetical protein
MVSLQKMLILVSAPSPHLETQAYTDSMLTNVAASVAGVISWNHRLKGNGADRAGRNRVSVSKFYINTLFISGFHSLTELSSSWETVNCAATQELPSILWNPEVHSCVHKSHLLVPILSQINPIHSIPSYLSKIHFIHFLSLRLFRGLWLWIHGPPPRQSSCSWDVFRTNFWTKLIMSQDSVRLDLC